MLRTRGRQTAQGAGLGAPEPPTLQPRRGLHSALRERTATSTGRSGAARRAGAWQEKPDAQTKAKFRGTKGLIRERSPAGGRGACQRLPCHRKRLPGSRPPVCRDFIFVFRRVGHGGSWAPGQSRGLATLPRGLRGTAPGGSRHLLSVLWTFQKLPGRGCEHSSFGVGALLRSDSLRASSLPSEGGSRAVHPPGGRRTRRLGGAGPKGALAAGLPLRPKFCYVFT